MDCAVATFHQTEPTLGHTEGLQPVSLWNNTDHEGNSLLEASISFGRFECESLAWEKRSVFSRSYYQDDVEKYITPGLVAQKRVFFEAYYKRASSVNKTAPLLGQTVFTTKALPKETFSNEVTPVESYGPEKIMNDPGRYCSARKIAEDNKLYRVNPIHIQIDNLASNILALDDIDEKFHECSLAHQVQKENEPSFHLTEIEVAHHSTVLEVQLKVELADQAFKMKFFDGQKMSAFEAVKFQFPYHVASDLSGQLDSPYSMALTSMSDQEGRKCISCSGVKRGPSQKLQIGSTIFSLRIDCHVSPFPNFIRHPRILQKSEVLKSSSNSLMLASHNGHFQKTIVSPSMGDSLHGELIRKRLSFFSSCNKYNEKKILASGLVKTHFIPQLKMVTVEKVMNSLGQTSDTKNYLPKQQNAIDYVVAEARVDSLEDAGSSMPTGNPVRHDHHERTVIVELVKPGLDGNLLTIEDVDVSLLTCLYSAEGQNQNEADHLKISEIPNEDVALQYKRMEPSVEDKPSETQENSGLTLFQSFSPGEINGSKGNTPMSDLENGSCYPAHEVSKGLTVKHSSYFAMNSAGDHCEYEHGKASCVDSDEDLYQLQREEEHESFKEHHKPDDYHSKSKSLNQVSSVEHAKTASLVKPPVKERSVKIEKRPDIAVSGSRFSSKRSLALPPTSSSPVYSFNTLDLKGRLCQGYLDNKKELNASSPRTRMDASSKYACNISCLPFIKKRQPPFAVKSSGSTSNHINCQETDVPLLATSTDAQKKILANSLLHKRYKSATVHESCCNRATQLNQPSCSRDRGSSVADANRGLYSSTSLPFTFKTEERAAKRREKERAKNTFKDLYKNLVFKARPLPLFYRQRGHKKDQGKKADTTGPKSPEVEERCPTTGHQRKPLLSMRNFTWSCNQKQKSGIVCTKPMFARVIKNVASENISPNIPSQ